MELKGRCMKCRDTRTMKDVTTEPTKRGTILARGTCSVCGTKMAKILSKEQAAKL